MRAASKGHTRPVLPTAPARCRPIKAGARAPTLPASPVFSLRRTLFLLAAAPDTHARLVMPRQHECNLFRASCDVARCRRGVSDGPRHSPRVRGAAVGAAAPACALAGAPAATPPPACPRARRTRPRLHRHAGAPVAAAGDTCRGSQKGLVATLRPQWNARGQQRPHAPCFCRLHPLAAARYRSARERRRRPPPPVFPSRRTLFLLAAASDTRARLVKPGQHECNLRPAPCAIACCRRGVSDGPRLLPCVGGAAVGAAAPACALAGAPAATPPPACPRALRTRPRLHRHAGAPVAAAGNTCRGLQKGLVATLKSH